eukprot:TRINITY_DN8566_c0_g1_i1.p1 TRINITY_DN8566_c0_g1~~TRINITY_DN8566_c0_g1_i1.p1  ORF type:complete len:485 (+),score=119.47 TRINITY_DN8566_c0_g1_i1:116-1456(+)
MQRTSAECSHRFPFAWADVVKEQERQKGIVADPALTVELLDDEEADAASAAGAVGGNGGCSKVYKYTVTVPWWARALLPAKVTAIDRVTQDVRAKRRVEVLSPGPGLAHIGRGSVTTIWESCPEDPNGATLYRKRVSAETRIPQAVVSRGLAWYLQGCEKVWHRCEAAIAAEIAARGPSAPQPAREAQSRAPPTRQPPPPPAGQSDTPAVQPSAPRRQVPQLTPLQPGSEIRSSAGEDSSVCSARAMSIVSQTAFVTPPSTPTVHERSDAGSEAPAGSHVTPVRVVLSPHVRISAAPAASAVPQVNLACEASLSAAASGAEAALRALQQQQQQQQQHVRTPAAPGRPPDQSASAAVRGAPQQPHRGSPVRCRSPSAQPAPAAEGKQGEAYQVVASLCGARCSYSRLRRAAIAAVVLINAVIAIHVLGAWSRPYPSAAAAMGADQVP